MAANKRDLDSLVDLDVILIDPQAGLLRVASDGSTRATTDTKDQTARWTLSQDPDGYYTFTDVGNRKAMAASRPSSGDLAEGDTEVNTKFNVEISKDAPSDFNFNSYRIFSTDNLYMVLDKGEVAWIREEKDAGIFHIGLPSDIEQVVVPMLLKNKALRLKTIKLAAESMEKQKDDLKLRSVQLMHAEQFDKASKNITELNAIKLKLESYGNHIKELESYIEEQKPAVRKMVRSARDKINVKRKRHERVQGELQKLLNERQYDKMFSVLKEAQTLSKEIDLNNQLLEYLEKLEPPPPAHVQTSTASHNAWGPARNAVRPQAAVNKNRPMVPSPAKAAVKSPMRQSRSGPATPQTLQTYGSQLQKAPPAAATYGSQLQKGPPAASPVPAPAAAPARRKPPRKAPRKAINLQWQANDHVSIADGGKRVNFGNQTGMVYAGTGYTKGTKYFEIQVDEISGYSHIGFVVGEPQRGSLQTWLGALTEGYCACAGTLNNVFGGYIFAASQQTADTICFRNPGDRVGFLIDCDARTCRVFTNDKEMGLIFTNIQPGPIYPAASNYDIPASYVIVEKMPPRPSEAQVAAPSAARAEVKTNPRSPVSNGRTQNAPHVVHNAWGTSSGPPPAAANDTWAAPPAANDAWGPRPSGTTETQDATMGFQGSGSPVVGPHSQAEVYADQNDAFATRAPKASFAAWGGAS